MGPNLSISNLKICLNEQICHQKSLHNMCLSQKILQYTSNILQTSLQCLTVSAPCVSAGFSDFSVFSNCQEYDTYMIREYDT